MKKLNAEEAGKLAVSGQGKTTLVSAMAATLKVDEAIIITRSDWKSKDAPYRIINYLAKKTGRTFLKGRLPDGSGWVIKRLS